MSEVTPDPAKIPEPDQPKAKKAAGPKTMRLRSKVGRFLILHTNTMIGEGEEKRVVVDDWVQAQINAGKLEVVVD